MWSAKASSVIVLMLPSFLPPPRLSSSFQDPLPVSHVRKMQEAYDFNAVNNSEIRFRFVNSGNTVQYCAVGWWNRQLHYVVTPDECVAESSIIQEQQKACSIEHQSYSGKRVYVGYFWDCWARMKVASKCAEYSILKVFKEQLLSE